MEDRGGEKHFETDEARSGSTPNIVRYVLVISTLLAIVAMSLVWIIPALTEGDVEEEATASGIVEATEEESGNIDGVVIDEADEIDEIEQETEEPLDTIPNEAQNETGI